MSHCEGRRGRGEGGRGYELRTILLVRMCVFVPVVVNVLDSRELLTVYKQLQALVRQRNALSERRYILT